MRYVKLITRFRVASKYTHRNNSAIPLPPIKPCKNLIRKAFIFYIIRYNNHITRFRVIYAFYTKTGKIF